MISVCELNRSLCFLGLSYTNIYRKSITLFYIFLGTVQTLPSHIDACNCGSNQEAISRCITDALFFFLRCILDLSLQRCSCSCWSVLRLTGAAKILLKTLALNHISFLPNEIYLCICHLLTFCTLSLKSFLHSRSIKSRWPKLSFT